MFEFIEALGTNPFLLSALLGGVLLSVSAGVVGTFVVTRRITYIAGSISHCVLGGMGAARYAATVHGISWLHPLHGAIASALLAAMIIGLVSLYAKEREDTLIGALWTIGMALGVLFIRKTPGYNEDLMAYLFGDILMTSMSDLWLIVGLDILVLLAVFLFQRQLLAVCFDEEFARLRGVPVDAFYLLFLCLTALTVVLLVTIVGIVMVIALLTLPAAIAGSFSRTLWQMMGLSALLVALFTSVGLGVSYVIDFPTGATIVLISGSVFVLVATGKSLGVIRSTS